jgi:hypothetical protein
MTRLRFSSAEILEEDTGDCDAKKRRAAVPEGEEAAAAWRRWSGTGGRDVAEEWAQRRARVESRGELAARRRSLAARDADDMVRASLFFSGGFRGRLLAKSRVLRGLKAWR